MSELQLVFRFILFRFCFFSSRARLSKPNLITDVIFVSVLLRRLLDHAHLVIPLDRNSHQRIQNFPVSRLSFSVISIFRHFAIEVVYKQNSRDFVTMRRTRLDFSLHHTTTLSEALLKYALNLTHISLKIIFTSKRGPSDTKKPYIGTR